MTNKQNADEQQWKLFVLLIEEIAKTKYGTGYQTKLAQLTGFQQSNISRIFSLKYKISLHNFLILAKAVKVNFFFEDQENQTELNTMFERAMEELGRRPNKLPKN
ncbi:hypothetical protein EZY14_002625 [Kordia sp. TARA_039_SRF]|nr:hypothetical protein EZY14_002625 [Kordia sp. TARA_039_SRF]